MNEFADYLETLCNQAGLAVHCNGAIITPRFVSYELVGASLAELSRVNALANYKLRQSGNAVACEVTR